MIAPSSRKMRRWRVPEKQPARASLQFDRDRLRREAAGVLSDAFPVPPKGAMRYAISRGRNGDESNPVHRCAMTLLACDSLVAAQRILAFLQSVVMARWEDSLPPDVQSALIREQESDGEEDLAEMLAIENPERLAVWIEVAERHKADLEVAIATARRHVARQRRAGA